MDESEVVSDCARAVEKDDGGCGGGSSLGSLSSLLALRSVQKRFTGYVMTG